jgi:hypothetical protein
VIGAHAAYTRTKPEEYDAVYQSEAKHDNGRSKKDCFCTSNTGTVKFWNGMLSNIVEGRANEETHPGKKEMSMCLIL